MGYTIFPDGALGEATEDAYREVLRAKDKHDQENFNSIHEAFAVLKEEVDELWEVVRDQKPSKSKLRKEAIQVAAMALRFASELDETINFKYKQK